MSSSDSSSRSDERAANTDRRDFLTRASSWAMAGGLVAGYGSFAAIALRYLYPTGEHDKGWRFVAAVKEFARGQSVEYTAPSGATVVIARQGESDEASSFIALSNICPHLGCQVNWEEQNNRFFCPCHNGIFDPEGNATAGPPGKAHQRLRRFPLRIIDGLLFIEAPLIAVGRAVALQTRPVPESGGKEARITSIQRPTREA